MVQKVSGGVGDDIQREKGHLCFKVYSKTLDLFDSIIFVSFLKFSLFSNLCQKRWVEERVQKYGFATRFIRPWCMHKYQYWDLNELSMLIPCIKIQPFVSKKKKCVCGEINSFTPPFFKVEKKRAHDSHCPRCYAPVLRSGHYHLIEIGFFFMPWYTWKIAHLAL